MSAATLPRLFLLTDRSQLRLGRGLVRTVAECADAGLEAVVVREHDLEPAARRALVAALAAVPGLMVVSSRLPDPAAHGLHLAAHQRSGSDEPSGSVDRSRLPWGRSCHSAAAVAEAAREGATWATLSPYAASASKPGHRPPLSPEEYSGHAVPVLALAGVTPANAAAAVDAGAHGVAVMGEVMRADEPAEVVADLLAALP